MRCGDDEERMRCEKIEKKEDRVECAGHSIHFWGGNKQIPNIVSFLRGDGREGDAGKRRKGNIPGTNGMLCLTCCVDV